jgi:hypothetical protein
MRATSLTRTGPVHRGMLSLVGPPRGASGRSPIARHSHRNWTRSRGLVIWYSWTGMVCHYDDDDNWNGWKITNDHLDTIQIDGVYCP